MQKNEKNDTTYRLIALGERGMYTYGETAATPELAKLVPGSLHRSTIQHPELFRLGIERTEWAGGEAVRHVVVEAESQPGEWRIGAE